MVLQCASDRHAPVLGECESRSTAVSKSETMSEDDRPRGILSPADRAYLRGEREFESESGARQARRRVRERTRHGIVDLGLVFHLMEQRDRDQLRLEYDPNSIYQLLAKDAEGAVAPDELVWDAINSDAFPWPIFTGGLKATAALGNLLLYEQLVEVFGMSMGRYEEIVAEMVEEGLKDALAGKDLSIAASVDVEIETLDVSIDELRQRFESGDDELAPEEVELLAHHRRLSPEEMSEYVSANQTPDAEEAIRKIELIENYIKENDNIEADTFSEFLQSTRPPVEGLG